MNHSRVDPARLIAGQLVQEAARDEFPRVRAARREAEQRERIQREATERAARQTREREQQARRRALAGRLQIWVWVAAFCGGVLGGLTNGSVLSSSSGQESANALVAILVTPIAGGAAAFSFLAEIQEPSRNAHVRPFTFVGRAVLFLIPFWLVVIPGMMIGWGLSKL